MVQYVDFGEKDWQARFKRGDIIHFLKVATCGICGCKSNRYEIEGYPIVGPKLKCPRRRKYPELHEAMREKKGTIDFNGMFGQPMLPRTVIAELEKEPEEDTKKFK